MHPLILAPMLIAQPDEPVTRVTFETLALADAERLHGKPVVTTFTVTTPSYTWGEGTNRRTVVGPSTVVGPRGAGSPERSAVLNGNRRDADLGARVTVAGTLRVIRHAPATINGRAFAGFTEIRIEERDMTPARLLALSTIAQPGESAAPVKFDTITLKEAEQLNGAAVTIRFTVATPAYTGGEGAKLCTIVGPADRGDGAEWTVALKGDRLHDADDGAKLTVTGRLRVITHAAAVVGGVTVPEWVEVWVTEG